MRRPTGVGDESGDGGGEDHAPDAGTPRRLEDVEGAQIDNLYSVHSNCHRKAGDKGMLKVPANAFPFLRSLEGN